MQTHILIVEDDKNVADGLNDVLNANGYRTSLADTRYGAMEILRRETIDLAILDVALGADSGYDLCKDIRRVSEMPILFLTACSGELELIRGFQCGGDDYLTKPFRLQELLARIQAVLRRASRTGAVCLRSGNCVIEPTKHQVKRDGIVLGLSSVEWKILLALVSRYPHTLSREELLYTVWDVDAEFVEANTLNVNISRLREKLGKEAGQSCIETVRGIGYRWTAPVEKI